MSNILWKLAAKSVVIYVIWSIASNIETWIDAKLSTQIALCQMNIRSEYFQTMAWYNAGKVILWIVFIAICIVVFYADIKRLVLFIREETYFHSLEDKYKE